MDVISFVNVFARAVIIGIYAIIGIMFVVWLKPFLIKKRLAYFAGLVHFIMTAGTFFIKAFSGNILFYILAVSVSFFIIYLFEKRNMELKIFICIIFVALWYSALAFTSEIDFIISDLVCKNEKINTSITAMTIEFVIQDLLWAALTALMMYMAIVILHRVFIFKYENMTWKELAVLLFPAIPVFLMKHFQNEYINLWNKCIDNGIIVENYPISMWRAGYYVASYVIILIVVYFYEKNKYELEQKKEAELVDSQKDALQRHIKSVEKLYEEQKSVRHDLANHIQIMEELLRSDEKEASSKYLNNMKNELSKITPKVITGNPVTDIILSEYLAQAGESSINFVSEFSYPANTEISAFDLSVILNNGLSNAFRGAKECDRPYVKIMSSRRKNILLIEIKNNYMGELTLDAESGFPTHIIGNGIGLKNINHIASKYNGTMDIELAHNGEEKEFILTIMLQMQFTT